MNLDVYCTFLWEADTDLGGALNPFPQYSLHMHEKKIILKNIDRENR